MHGREAADRAWAAGLAARLAAVLLGLAVPLVAAGQAAGAARVTTQIDPCVPIEPVQFHRVLAIELGTSIEYSAEASPSDAGANVTHVRLTCPSANTVALWLEDAVTRKSMQRLVELPLVDAGARGRLLALAVAEFVVASWVELRFAEPLPLSPVGPAPPLEAAASAQHASESKLASQSTSDRAPAWQLRAASSTLLFSRAGLFVPGFALEVLQRPLRDFAFSLAFDIGHADPPASASLGALGDVALTSSSARIAGLYVARASAFELEAGLGGRIGLVHFAGRTERLSLHSASFFAPWGGPVVLFGIALRATRYVRLLLELEAGLVTQPAQARANDEVVAQLNGVWSGASLGLGLAF
jgi:hypothetical protein